MLLIKITAVSHFNIIFISISLISSVLSLILILILKLKLILFFYFLSNFFNLVKCLLFFRFLLSFSTIINLKINFRIWWFFPFVTSSFSFYNIILPNIMFFLRLTFFFLLLLSCIINFLRSNDLSLIWLPILLLTLISFWTLIFFDRLRLAFFFSLWIR